MWYKLDQNNKVVLCEDAQEAMEWWSENKNLFYHQSKKGSVSTIFLGMAHGFNQDLFFESLFVEKGKKEKIIRYRTYEEALENHLILKQILCL